MHFIKLNVDGSSLGNSGPSGGGGLVRDHFGHVLTAFSSFYGHCTSLKVEARALLDGLIVCASLDCLPVIVEMDSLTLLNVI